jgi:membrane protein
MGEARAKHPTWRPELSIEGLQAWFTDRVWRVGPEAPAPLRAIASVSRLGYATFRGFFENRLTLRAAALTYYSILSVVPLLAFAFAVLKGLGAYTGFVQGVVHPYLQRTFGENPSLLEAVEYVFKFVDRTNVSTLGVVGLVALVYTSVSLLSNVEATFNVIWGARTQRPFVRQVTDYVTLLVTTPLLVLVATTFATAAQSSALVQFLRDTLELGGVIDFVLQFTSLVVVAAALFGLFVILPNVHVRSASAALGAAVSALLWQVVLMLHVQFQVGMAKYNALYSVLGSVPVFLVWTYFSWVMVLAGAQVAASHQRGRTMGERFVAKRVDQALRERVAVALSAMVTRDFRAGTRRPEVELADLVQLPRAPVDEVIGALVRAGVLARTVAGRETYLLPGRDPATLRALDVRDALRREAEADAARAVLEAHLAPPLRDVLDGLDQEFRRSPRNLTLVELSSLVGGPPEEAPPPRGEPLAAARADPVADHP